MKIYEYGVDAILHIKRSVALGFFDGVHLGHRKIIESAVSHSATLGATPSVFTFFGERGGFKSGAPRIYPTEKKLEILESLGIKEVVIADFSRVSSITAEDFVRGVLTEDLSAVSVHLGYNYRFGSGGRGTAETLSHLFGGVTDILPEYRFGDGELSSTVIRKVLAVGDVTEAGKMLGAPYSITGQIVHGMGLGHSLGCPTVNIDLSPDCPLRHGVYSTTAKIGDNTYPAITNIGVCPTVGERDLHAETHLLGFSGEIYGEKCTIYFTKFIRDEMQFSSKEELAGRIELDKKIALEEKNYVGNMD